MSYNANTGMAIQFKYPNAEPFLHYAITRSNGVVNIDLWDATTIGATKPTPADIDKILNSPEYRTASGGKHDLRNWLKKHEAKKSLRESMKQAELKAQAAEYGMTVEQWLAKLDARIDSSI